MSSSSTSTPVEVECSVVEVFETPEIVTKDCLEDGIYVGKSFGSFEELQNFIMKFERDHKQKFWIRSSRSVEAARKILKRPLSENIRYYELQYSCIHGGLEFKTRGKGIRNMSTHKMNCPAKIKLRATPDGNKLEIRSFVSKHEGHAMSEDVFQLLPQNRKKTRTSKLRKFLTVDYARGKKRKVPAHLIEDIEETESATGFIDNTVDDDVLKDLVSGSQSEINKSLLLLRDEYGAHTMVLYDEVNTFKALYFYTSDMKKSLFAWPEVVFIWGIPNWLSRNYTVILLSVKDSNGMSDVVGVGVLCDDDKDALNWFLQTFRNVFPSDKPLPTKCIFSYKSLVENELQTVFHDIPVRVSTHYSVKTFHKIMTTDRFLVSNKEREICTKLFNKMLFNKTLDEFKVMHSLFRKVVPSFIVEYFRNEWESTKDLWAVHSFPPHSYVDLNKTNKENSLDNRLKQVIPKDSTILTFIKQLLRWLDSLKAETKYKASVHILKKPVVNPSKGSWQDLYSSYLTQYAFNYVSQQIIQSSGINVLGETDDSMYIVQEDTNCFSVSASECQCIDWISMRLPCRHVFTVREFMNISFYDETLCNYRWSKQYYLDHRLEITTDTLKNADKIKMTPPTVKSSPRFSEKSVTVANRLLRLMHNSDFIENRIKTLEQIADSWSRGYEVSISEPENDPLPMEAQEVIEEEVTFDDHDPENMSFLKAEPLCSDEEQTVVTIDESNVSKTTIVEVPEPENMSCASVLMTFDVPKLNKNVNPVKFALQTDMEKIKMILSWISKSEELMEEALNGNYILTAVDIELEPQNIKHSILHESVDLNLLEKYLERPALDELKACVQQKRVQEVWQCFICETALDDDCVLCCSCLLWFHPKCVGLPSPQKRKLWFCYSCHLKVPHS